MFYAKGDWRVFANYTINVIPFFLCLFYIVFYLSKKYGGDSDTRRNFTSYVKRKHTPLSKDFRTYRLESKDPRSR